MFKKFLAIIFSALLFLTLANFLYFNSNYALGGVGKNHTLYLSSSSSQIIKASVCDKILGKVKAESCEVSLDFDVLEFFNSLGASLSFIEQTDDTISYYAFSPKISYLENIKGEKINLHVSINKERIKIGTPIIYESF